MTSAPSPNTKLERLVVAAAVAPSLRSQTIEQARRRVFVVGKDGEVVCQITVAELQEGILARAKIELAVDETLLPQTRCVGWGDLEGCCSAIPHPKAFHADKVARRGGAPWMCFSCSQRKKTGSTKVLTTTCACGAAKDKTSKRCAACAGNTKKPKGSCSCCGAEIPTTTKSGMCRSCFCKQPAFYAKGIEARRARV